MQYRDVNDILLACFGIDVSKNVALLWHDLFLSDTHWFFL